MRLLLDGFTRASVSRIATSATSATKLFLLSKMWRLLRLWRLSVAGAKYRFHASAKSAASYAHWRPILHANRL